MKKCLTIPVSVLLFCTLASWTLASCASTPSSFNEVKNRDWHLAEIRTWPTTIRLDRDVLARSGFVDVFVLRFEDERLSGVGAPNRYFAPYSLEGTNAISIGLLAGTLMASIAEPEYLKEYEYFTFLQNAHRWNISNGKLELHSRKDNGTRAVLVFTL